MSLRMFLEGENKNLALMGLRREKSLQVTPHFRFGRQQPPRTRWFVGRFVSSGWRVALEHALDARMRESAGQERDMEPGGWRITHLESRVRYLKNYPVFQGPGGPRKLSRSTSKQTAMSLPSDVNRTLAAVPSGR